MLNDILKVYMYGYVKDISHELDPAAEPWNLEIDQNIKQKWTKQKKEIDQDIEKGDTNKTSSQDKKKDKKKRIIKTKEWEEAKGQRVRKGRQKI